MKILFITFCLLFYFIPEAHAKKKFYRQTIIITFKETDSYIKLDTLPREQRYCPLLMREQSYCAIVSRCPRVYLTSTQRNIYDIRN